jgi:predicted GIY-YIG superfamily endonuclease
MKNKNGYWTFERCKEVALLCDSRTELCSKHVGAYYKAINKNWLDIICIHMFKIHKPKNFWNYDKCQEVSLLCYSRSDFYIKYNSAYHAAYRKGWLNTICSHMKNIGNKYFRCIYVWEFEDNSAYIGLTGNLEERTNYHNYNKNSPVLKYKKMIINPICKQLSDYVVKEEAQILEEYFINKYKQAGWNILNKAKAGSLGGSNKYWTKERCQKVASTCSSRKAFHIKYSSAYNSARFNKWMNEICLHMNTKSRPYGYWTYEQCEKSVLLCKSKKEFSKNFYTAYKLCRKNKWLDNLCSHMNILRNPNGYWTKEKCKEIALLCKSRSDFINNYSGAYNSAIKNNFYSEIVDLIEKH